MNKTYDMKKIILLISFSLFLLSSCHITKEYNQINVYNDSLYRDSFGNDTNTIANIPWQEFFIDENLQALIQKALSQNLDLKMAIERINVANAYFKQSKLAFLPDLNSSVSVRQSKLAFPQGFGLINSSTQYDLIISSSWELDIWGKLKSSKKAALANLLKTEAAKRAVQSQLVSEVAFYYYQLLSLDNQLEILEKTLENRKLDVSAMKDLKASNIVNGAAVVQSEANQYSVEVAIPDVKRLIKETENMLSFLIASPSETVNRKSLGDEAIPQELSVGIPAQLLKYRPDVQAAELEFRIAFEQTNVARTAFYPNINITGSAGFSSLDFSKWFTADGLFANIMGGLTQPIFNKGMNKANLSSAEANQEIAFHNFKKSVLIAGQEVSNALYAMETAKEKESSRIKQIESLTKAVDFTKELLKYSETTNYTDVLTSEQNLLNAELGIVNDRVEQWIALIYLYKATGGGVEK